LKILVLNGPRYSLALSGLGDIEYGTRGLFSRPQDYAMVLFTGGADVDPKFYNESSPQRRCMANTARDIQEEKVFKFCLEHDIKMTGICRGLQFLNVMAGGRLMHHIDNHEGGMHSMTTSTGKHLVVNSLHHQMVIPSDHSMVTGWSTHNYSGRYFGDYDIEITYRGLEVEAAIFPKIKAFGVQYHPEMLFETTSGYKYYHSMAEDALNLPWEKFVATYAIGDDDVNILKVSKCYGPHP
jgi:gamma-glutamyl-gamma-aminobutyrate hydrolase PuuD